MGTREMNMCEGGIFSKIIKFSIPLMLSGILQLLFNAADIVVVGNFSGPESLAAVGSTSALINLIINLFIGVSIGASVLMGKYIGARDYKNANDTVHCAMFIALFGGVILSFVGLLFAKPLLIMMDTPSDVINLSTIYMVIYFVGMPGFMIYNFGSALLRAIGDTKTPLYYLFFAGIFNVILNLILVIVFSMGVQGVAIATVVSQYISGGLILLLLIKSDDVLHLNIKKMKIHKDKLKEMLRVGLPAGLQGMIFSISNVLIQSSVNSFGSLAMAGNTAASNIESFIYTSMNAVYQTALSFTSQNMGAKTYKRIDKILIECLIFVTIIGIVMGVGAYMIGDKLLLIYTNDMNVVNYGLMRMSIISKMYFICGLMDVMCGSLRGMGYAILPMVVSLIGVCLLRIVWIYTIFKVDHSLVTLYISYPISWFVTALVHMLGYLYVRRKVLKVDYALQ